MKRRTKKTMLIIVLTTVLISMFSIFFINKSNEEKVLPSDTSIVLTYVNGVDLRYFIFNKK